MSDHDLTPGDWRREATIEDLRLGLGGVSAEIRTLTEATKGAMIEARNRHETLKKISIALGIIIGLMLVKAFL